MDCIENGPHAVETLTGVAVVDETIGSDIIVKKDPANYLPENFERDQQRQKGHEYLIQWYRL